MKTIAILFGGRSSEYEVSLVSATGVYNNINKEKYNIILVGITKEGKFYVYDDDPSLIECDKWVNGKKYPLSLDLANRLFSIEKDGITETIKVDAVLPMVHGKYCEDGTLQGMFAIADIPLVGCGCQSSAVCMDKSVTKSIVSLTTSVLQANAVVARNDGTDIFELRKECEKKLGYPMFVKPARAGSSVGVTKVKAADDFEKAVRTAFMEDDKLLIEEAVPGREMEVAVLEEGGRYTVAHPAEIDNGGAEFYDYDTKYITNTSSFHIPALIPEQKQDEIRKYALDIFKALDCKGLARVDFFFTPDEKFVFNEINTLPGFTPISMYPKMMIHEGISYSELIDRLIGTVL